MNVLKKNTYILAIESSCDETSLALMKNKEIIECWTWSQVNYFQKYGGVVPQIASRLHMEKLPVLLKELIAKYPVIWAKINYIAYTKKPGLIGCLRIGRAFAKTIAMYKQIPLVPINHLEGHIYAVTITEEIQFPALALIVSGGHTQLLYSKEDLDFQLIGSTVDDAAGEVIDKIARKMGLPYPGGPAIEELAKTGAPIYKMSVYENRKDLNFSFSGLKTNAAHLWDKTQQDAIFKNNFAASFQSKIIHVLIKKVNLARAKFPIKNLILCGGVAANQALRNGLKKNIAVPVIIPPKEYCTDNAAMIGTLAFQKIAKAKYQNELN